MPAVAGVSGQCRETTSLLASSSGSGTWRTPCSASAAGSSGRSLEHSTVQPKPRSRRATACPMAPNPTSPTVLPDSRKAGRAKLPPIQRPSESSAAACAMERRVEIISPIVSSATGTALLPVVRATFTPRRRAASRSRLSTPTPHLCSSRSRRAAPSTAAFTAIWPEMAKSASAMMPWRCASSRAVPWVSAKPSGSRARSLAAVASVIGSSTTMVWGMAGTPGGVSGRRAGAGASLAEGRGSPGPDRGPRSDLMGQGLCASFSPETEDAFPQPRRQRAGRGASRGGSSIAAAIAS